DERITQDISTLVGQFANSQRVAFRHVREPLAGKCRAQNAAIRAAKGDIMVFFDDDVEVAPQWLSVAAEFFQRQEFDAMQGPILMPPELEHNEELLRAQQRFRTINFVKYRPGMTELKTMTGANMAVRREVFTRIGYFNEDLGPGRSGISEDVEFAQRLVRGGGRIGYEPRAGVYHRVDWSRLTEEFFRLRHEQQGRSRLIYKKQSLASIVPNFLRSIWTFGWYSLLGNERKKYRAKGRYFHYRAMLEVKTSRIMGIHD
ncbi:MAG: glycosyltransferase, partial [Candidatus Binatia bacterium]|nr:glycosyltransferase [Candidatus Binatia bacterium]